MLKPFMFSGANFTVTALADTNADVNDVKDDIDDIVRPFFFWEFSSFKANSFAVIFTTCHNYNFQNYNSLSRNNS